MANKNYIILIPGIKLTDIRAAIARAKTPSRAEEKHYIDFANYSAIPQVFTTIAEHPKTSNLLCWHCGLSFGGYPRFVPTACTPKDAQKVEWRIEGNFCSWACAVAYVNAEFDATKKWTMAQNIAIVRKQIDGGPIRSIKAAPSRLKMRAYCGSGLTQQEYSDLVESLSRDF